MSEFAWKKGKTIDWAREAEKIFFFFLMAMPLGKGVDFRDIQKKKTFSDSEVPTAIKLEEGA